MGKLRVALIAAVSGAALATAVGWALSLQASTANAEFAGEADQLCDDYHRAADEVGSSGSLASVPALVARQKPLALALARQLEQLDPPASQARDYASFLALVRRQIALLEAERSAAVAHRPRGFERTAAESRRVHAAEARLAEELDFFVCGR